MINKIIKDVIACRKNLQEISRYHTSKELFRILKLLRQFKKDNNIWKDPKVELPKNDSNVVIVMKKGRGALYSEISYYDKLFQYWPNKHELSYYDVDGISKWCYEEDLIKQAGDK